MAVSVAASPLSSQSCYPEANLRHCYPRAVSTRFLSPASHIHLLPAVVGIGRSQTPSDSSSFRQDRSRWDSVLKNAAKKAVRWWNQYTKADQPSLRNGCPDVGGARCEKEPRQEEWDWTRWKKHFKEIEEQEKLVSVLKSQLASAVEQEDYWVAARLKIAIAAVTGNDTVGRAISQLNRALKEERYKDAAFINGHVGTWLPGWWAGISEDSDDPYGRIICISAEYGKYMARSYSSRQLATGSSGVPLFEVYFTANNEGQYKQQVVHMIWNREHSRGILAQPGSQPDLLLVPFFGMRGSQSDFFEAGLSGIRSLLQDMIPGVRVLKITGPIKVDKDLIVKSIEMDLEEEEDNEVGGKADEIDDEVDCESEDGGEDDGKFMFMEVSDSDIKQPSPNKSESVDGQKMHGYGEDESEMVLRYIISCLIKRFSNDAIARNFHRLPARLEKRNNLSFTLSTRKSDSKQGKYSRREQSMEKIGEDTDQYNVDLIMSELARVLARRKTIPRKVLRGLKKLASLSLSEAQNHQPLSGSMLFNRIEIQTTSDPLTGLYMGSYGLCSSEIIHLRHRVGQWQDDGGSHNPLSLEIYEYVEALKLTGDPYVPAGQVAFRAKVGWQNQLPHKGVIPEEFGCPI